MRIGLDGMKTPFYIRSASPQDQSCIYVFTGEFIYTFYTQDKNDKNVSSIGNNGIHYAIGFGEKKLHLLPKKKIIPFDNIEDDKDRKNAYEKYDHGFA